MMTWTNHTESLLEDDSILIETSEKNREDFWLERRVKKYERKGRKVHVKFLKEKGETGWTNKRK